MTREESLQPALNPEHAMTRLLAVMDDLRENCPWDRKQTIHTLRHLTIEETHELSEAILDEDWADIRKELGDLLLHIVFYSRIAREQQAFSIVEVVNTLCDKLIHRHPHIYGDVQAGTAEEVLANWEQIKLREGNASVLAGVPASLPALLKALRMQEKAAGVGFDWPDSSGVLAKVAEELEELKTEAEAATPDSERMEEEYGDLLFALVNYARWAKINPETALENANRKFKSRFNYIEQQAVSASRHLPDMTLDEMDALWNEAKRKGM